MLMVREKLLKKRKGVFFAWEFVCKSFEKETICGHWMWEHFDIPEGVAGIWLSLHTRSAAERYEATIKMYDGPCTVPWPEIQVEDTCWDCEALDELFEKLVGKSLYLQCEYEACVN